MKRISKKKGPIDLVIDSTGLKVFGEGEWKVRLHKASKRRKWKKIHLGIDPLDNEIVSAKVTPSHWTDGTVFSLMEPTIRVIAIEKAANGIVN